MNNNNHNFCFIDFETTGIDVFQDQPVEIGAVVSDFNFKVIKEFHSYIGIEDNIQLNKSAFNIHGLSLEFLKNQPSPKEVLNKFFKTLGTDFRFVGWNISFDIPFMRKLCHENDFMTYYNDIYHRHIDVQTINFLANELGFYGGKNKIFSLNDLISYFNIKRNEKHNALEDAYLTLKMMKRLMNLFSDKNKREIVF